LGVDWYWGDFTSQAQGTEAWMEGGGGHCSISVMARCSEVIEPYIFILRNGFKQASEQLRLFYIMYNVNFR